MLRWLDPPWPGQIAPTLGKITCKDLVVSQGGRGRDQVHACLPLLVTLVLHLGFPTNKMQVNQSLSLRAMVGAGLVLCVVT